MTCVKWKKQVWLWICNNVQGSHFRMTQATNKCCMYHTTNIRENEQMRADANEAWPPQTHQRRLCPSQPSTHWVNVSYLTRRRSRSVLVSHMYVCLKCPSVFLRTHAKAKIKIARSIHHPSKHHPSIHLIHPSTHPSTHLLDLLFLFLGLSALLELIPAIKGWEGWLHPG